MSVHVRCAFLFMCIITLVPVVAPAAKSSSLEPLFLPGDEVIGPAAGDQTDPVIERGGDQYLTVWIDHRTNLWEPDNLYFGLTGLEGAADIYAARLNADGALIDSIPIVISRNGSNQTEPRATWNGSEWLVTWLNRVPYGPASIPQVLGVRISGNGEILDSTPIEIRTFGSSDEKVFGVASDGAGWAVFTTQVYASGLGTKTRLVAQYVSAGATFVSGLNYIFSPSSGFFFNGDVAFGQDQYLVVQEGMNVSAYTGIVGIRVEPDLDPIDSYPFNIAYPPGGYPLLYQDPNVVSDGTDFFVSWVYRQSGSQSRILCGRVTAAAQSLDGNGLDLSGPLGFNYDRKPLVTWDGGNYIAGWEEQGLRLARITPGGTILDPDGILFADFDASGIAGTSVGGLHAVWSDDRAGGQQPFDIYGARVEADLAAQPEACLSFGASSQTLPQLASNGTGYLAVYESRSSGESRIHAHLLDGNGNGLTTEPILVGSGVDVTFPGVAWNGSLYIVIWTDREQDTVYARRILADGSVLDGTPLGVMAGEANGVSALGDTFLVAGTDAPLAPSNRMSYAVRVRGSDGTVLDPSPIELGNSYALSPNVTVLGNRWLVAWERHLSMGDSLSDIYGAFVERNGASPGEFLVRGDPSVVERSVTLATAKGIGTGMALIAWDDDRNGDGDKDIYALQIFFDGTLGDGAGIRITPVGENQFRPTAVWDDNTLGFVLAFQDFRNRTFSLDRRSDIYGTYLGVSGDPPVDDGFTLARDADPEIQPSLLEEGGEIVLIASFFQSEEPYTSYRAGLLFLSDEATSVANAGPAPTAPRLREPQPNPFNPSTTIRFVLPEPARVRLAVYDLAGRRVITLAEEHFGAGEHQRAWNGKNRAARDVASGVYYVRLQAGDFTETERMVLVR